MKERVEEALKKIRPALEADGGGIELVLSVFVRTNFTVCVGEFKQAIINVGIIHPTLYL